MHKKGPDPDGFRSWLTKKARATRHTNNLGDGRELGKTASRFGLSSEAARGILRSEGWEMRPTPSGALPRWHPPEEGAEGG